MGGKRGCMQGKLSFIILAAGHGTRFGAHPKVLTDLGGRTCLEEVLSITSDADTVIVLNESIPLNTIPISSRVKTVIQASPTGTLDAFQLGLGEITAGHVCVLFGDSPLTSNDTITRALALIEDYDIVFSGFHSSDTFNQYGRIIPGNPNRILEFTEHPEPSELYNGGWMLFNARFINQMTSIRLRNRFLTQYLEFGKSTFILVPEEEALGINTPADYQRVRSIINRRRVFELIRQGVQVLDPATVTLSYGSEVGTGSILEPNLFFGPQVKLGSYTTVKANTVLECVTAGNHCTLGPFGYFHDVTIGDECHLGAFCEVTRSKIGNRTKAKHLAYLGDVEVGNRVNIGAGSVFCNYDGRRKQACLVEDEVFLGSNCSFVAPIRIGRGAYIGAGTTVRKDVDSGALYVANPSYMEYKK